MVAATWSIDPTEVNDTHVQAAEILQAANTVFSTSSTRPTKAQDRRLAHPSSSSFAQMPDQDAPYSANAFASPVLRSEFRMYFNLTGAG
jgi:hypothetical protein